VTESSEEKPNEQKNGDVHKQAGLFGDIEDVSIEENTMSPAENEVKSAAKDSGKEKKNKSNKKKSESFEKLLERLEEIVVKMEDGGLSLDESIKLYEEGMKNAGKLTGMLADARNRVMKLVEERDGSFKLEPVEDDAEDDGESADEG
jgi:exodeoxyribonuclease VII small subunit